MSTIFKMRVPFPLVKAVIPAAGQGTRFLPYTIAQPKEMIPVVDEPAIQYVIEEAVASGLSDIIVVTSRGKRAIEDHFDARVAMNNDSGEGSVNTLPEGLRRLILESRIAYVRQGAPRGLGDAILCAEPFVGDDAFAVLLGDDIMVDDVPCTRQLRDAYERLGSSVLAVQPVATEEVSQYGMVVGEEIEPGIIRLESITEKPAREEIRSNIASIGRYLLTPAIFRHLRKTGLDASSELQLTDAIQSLLGEEDVYGLVYKGRRYDVGDKVGWLIATLDLALKRPEFREPLLRFYSDYMSQSKSADIG